MIYQTLQTSQEQRACEMKDLGLQCTECVAGAANATTLP